MTIKTTRWSPDTCGCILDYSWDDAVPEDQRTITFSTVITKCPAHASLNNNSTWAAVNDENPRKNISRQLLLENAPTTVFDLVDEFGNRTFKNGINLNWVWTGTAPNRVLELTITGITLTNGQKNAIRNVLNNRFGVGKITLT